MTYVTNLVNSTLAGQLAKKLDSMDLGGTDGKIEASIWNAFVADKGGKSISYSISIENALKSITTYATREGQKLGEHINDVVNKWTSNISSTMEKVKDNNPPAKLNSKYTTQNMSNANKTITDPRTKQQIHYNSDGYVDNVKTKYGNTVFERSENSLINYGLNGEHDVIIDYNHDGSVKEYERYKETGNKSKSQTYNSDGTLKSYAETEFDGRGNVLKETVYNPDGSVKSTR